MLVPAKFTLLEERRQKWTDSPPSSLRARRALGEHQCLLCCSPDGRVRLGVGRGRGQGNHGAGSPLQAPAAQFPAGAGRGTHSPET